MRTRIEGTTARSLWATRGTPTASSPLAIFRLLACQAAVVGVAAAAAAVAAAGWVTPTQPPPPFGCGLPSQPAAPTAASRSRSATRRRQEVSMLDNSGGNCRCGLVPIQEEEDQMGNEDPVHLADPEAARAVLRLPPTSTASAQFVPQPTPLPQEHKQTSRNQRSSCGPVAAPARSLPHLLRRRRDVTAQLLLLPASTSGWASWLAMTAAAAAESSSFQDVDPASSPCSNGGLAPETPVPGAYQNACMELEQRRVPVVVVPVRVTTTAKLDPPTADDDNSVVVWLTVEQRPSQVGAGSTGKAVWNSGILLSRLLQRLAARADEDHPGWLFHDKTVLELGCGVGLGSMTCALLGAKRVYATDGNDGVIDVATRNVARNRLESVVTTTVLPWGTLPAMDYSERMDWVIGSDLTYSPGSWRALAESMETVLKPDGYVLYVSLGHAGFPVSAEVDGFVTVAREMGLVPVTSSFDPLWPFPSSMIDPNTGSGRSLSDLLVQECLFDAREREIVESSGGVRVVLLTHKRSAKSSARA